MKTSKKIVPQNSENVKNLLALNDLKRKYEKSLDGNDLQELATAMVFTSLKHMIDAMKKAQAKKDAENAKKNGTDNGNTANGNAKTTAQGGGNAGCDPLIMRLRRQTMQDVSLLRRTRYANDNGYKTEYDNDGNCVTVGTTSYDKYIADSITSQSLSDGMDLVQTVALALWEVTVKYRNDGPCWLDKPIVRMALAQKVLTDMETKPQYTEKKSTPCTDAYRALNRYIDHMRSIRNNSTYLYAQADGQDNIDAYDRLYYRALHYANLGGEDANGNITTDYATLRKTQIIIKKMALSPQQNTILKLRMQGLGHKAIAQKLNLHHSSVRRQTERIREKYLNVKNSYIKARENT